MDFAEVTGGIFSQNLIRALIHEHALFGAFSENIHDIFLDITATQEIYRIPGAIIPQKGERVRSLLKKISAISLPPSSPLERQCSYLVRVRETLVLPSELFAHFSMGKSNKFTVELLGDGVCFSNELPSGYTGELWAHIIPHEGPLFLGGDEVLGSLSFFKKYLPVSLGDILTTHQASPLFFDRDGHATLPFLREDHSILLTLRADEPLFTKALTETSVHTEECISLPETFAACIRSPYQRRYLPSGFGKYEEHGSSPSLPLQSAQDTLWQPRQPLCTLELIPVAQQKRESPALYTPDPEENLKIE